MQIDCYGFEISMGSDHCRKLLITTYSEDLMAILFSRLIAFVECCAAVQANRIGSKTMTLEQGIRYLSREGEVRHHGQTENSRQAADFSRKRSANPSDETERQLPGPERRSDARFRASGGQQFTIAQGVNKKCKVHLCRKGRVVDAPVWRRGAHDTGGR